MDGYRYSDDSSEDERLPLTKKDVDVIWNADIKKKGIDSDSDGEENAIAETQQQRSMMKSASVRHKILLFDLIFTDFMLYFGISAANPFFSRVAVAKGGKVFNSALILQSLMLSLTIASVVFGKIQSKIGCKKLFMFGVSLFGMSQFAFGFLEFVDDIRIFTALGVTLRLLGGVGIAAYMVSSLTIAFREYPQYVSKIVGLYEAAVGTAYLTGPLFGGVLYDLSGMCLPFAVSGGIVLISLPAHFLVIKSNDGETTEVTEEFDLLKLLKKPVAAMTLISHGCVFGICGYYNVGFTTYVEKSGFSTSHAGFAMFGSGMSYGIVSPITGYVVGLKRWLPAASIIVGDALFGASILLFAHNQTRPLIYLACFCEGSSAAIATVPTMERLIYLANDNKPPSADFNPRIYSGVSGITFAAMGFGMAVFPMLSSWLQGVLGSFSEEMFTLSMFEFGMAISILCLCLAKRTF